MTINRIILTSELAALGMDRDLRTRARRGQVHRIVQGAYVDSGVWADLDSDARYRLTVAAVSRVLPDTQFCRDSAAAIWRLPALRGWPTTVHAAGPRASGGRSGALVRRHGFGIDANGSVIDGIPVTSLARTLAEVASGPSFGRAVGMLDHALRESRTTKGAILRELESLDGLRGRSRARLAVDFADGGAESLGESLSRVQMHALGVPAPELQVSFSDYLGTIGTVDFYWRELRLVGEFDGLAKYGDARRFDADLDPADIVIKEKEREDRLRALGLGVVRWNWTTALDRYALASRLEQHGLPCRRRGGFDHARA